MARLPSEPDEAALQAVELATNSFFAALNLSAQASI